MRGDCSMRSRSFLHACGAWPSMMQVRVLRTPYFILRKWWQVDNESSEMTGCSDGKKRRKTTRTGNEALPTSRPAGLQGADQHSAIAWYGYGSRHETGLWRHLLSYSVLLREFRVETCAPPDPASLLERRDEISFVILLHCCLSLLLLFLIEDYFVSLVVPRGKSGWKSA